MLDKPLSDHPVLSRMAHFSEKDNIFKPSPVNREYSYLRRSQVIPWFREAKSPLDVPASSTAPSGARVWNSPTAELLYRVTQVAPPFRDQYSPLEVAANKSAPITSRSRNVPTELMQNLLCQVLPPLDEYSILFFCALIRRNSLPQVTSCGIMIYLFKERFTSSLSRRGFSQYPDKTEPFIFKKKVSLGLSWNLGS